MYYCWFFGKPSAETPGGWRIEGHHLPVNYTSTDKRLGSATPEFMGANPAIVPSGPEKGLQVLKDESELGFQLLHSLSDAQLQTTLISAEAPSDIITGNKRTVMLEHKDRKSTRLNPSP